MRHGMGELEKWDRDWGTKRKREIENWRKRWDRICEIQREVEIFRELERR